MSDPTPTPDTAPKMSDKDWWTLRRLIQDNADRYEHEPKLQSVRDGLKGALAYMDGMEQYRSMDTPAARSVAGTAAPARPADILEGLGKPVMHAARDAVNSCYHDVHEGAVDLAAITALDVARRALIDATRAAGSGTAAPEPTAVRYLLDGVRSTLAALQSRRGLVVAPADVSDDDVREVLLHALGGAGTAALTDLPSRSVITAEEVTFPGCDHSNPDLCNCATWAQPTCDACDEELVAGDEVFFDQLPGVPWLPAGHRDQEATNWLWHVSCDQRAGDGDEARRLAAEGGEPRG